jgi:hypothetical protein
MKWNGPPQPGNNGSQAPLPRPNAKMKLGGSGTDFTEEEVRAAAKAIRKDGPEEFLVNLLHVLRESLKTTKVVP